MKKQKLTYIIILITATFIFVYSGTKIYTYLSEAQKEKTSISTLSANAVITTIPTPSPNSENLSPTFPLKVDFSYLQNENPDIKAWLYQPDTIINYPILQSDDNDYYLHRLTDKTTNSAGSLFIDYRNAPDFSDYITIIYGHNMKNSSMFGTIDNYKTQSYYDEHPIMYLATPQTSYTLNLVAGYVTDADSNTYIIPNTIETRNEFLTNAIKSSAFKSSINEADIQADAPLVMLSTCSYEYENARFVMIGVLE